MSLKLYMDVHVPDAITAGLRLRGVDVYTAQEDGARRFPDALLLDRATALERVLFSQDRDLLREAAQRQQHDVSFAGLVYAHQLGVTIGQCVRDLELLALTGDPEDFVGRVESCHCGNRGPALPTVARLLLGYMSPVDVVERTFSSEWRASGRREA